MIRYLVDLYESWDAAEPGKGYADKAAEWRAKLQPDAEEPPGSRIRAESKQARKTETTVHDRIVAALPKERHQVGKDWTMKQMKVIVGKHPDGYVAYPLGCKGVVVGEGDSYEEALADVTSAIRFHVKSFGPAVWRLGNDVVPLARAVHPRRGGRLEQWKGR